MRSEHPLSAGKIGQTQHVSLALRVIACALKPGRFGVKADLKWLAGPAGLVENDPKRHFFAGSPKPDHLAKKRLISSKNRAVAGSCFKKR